MNENEIDLKEEVEDKEEKEVIEEPEEEVNKENIEQEKEREDLLLQALSYEDKYYNSVLTYLSNINSNQETVLSNQDTLIDQNKNINTTLNCIFFVICVVFIYNFVRNMIRV